MDTFESLYDEEAVAAHVRHEYDEAARSLRTEMRDYWLNHSFLHGFQWLYWHDESGRLDQIPKDPDRIQATVNRLWPNTRTVMSTLMQRELAFEVPPKAADDSHVRGARLAETIIRSVHHDHDWEGLRENVNYAVWKGGTAAICVDWDEDLESTLDDDLQGNPIAKGDTYEEHLNITQFVVEPGVRNAERARWWIKAVALPPEDVQAMFGLDEEPPADATAGLTPFARKMLNVDRGGVEGTEIEELTTILTYYERPNPLCPEGKVVVVVDNKCVFEEKWYFPWRDRLNLVIVRETLRENRWTGDTVLTAARPLQTLLNVSWSSIAEHMKLAGNARLMVPYSSIEMVEGLSDLPGEIIPYNDGMQVKPDYLSPPQMPGWWIQQPGEIAKQIDDIMGVHEISRGAAPANIESGFGLTILAEKDSTPTTRLTKEISGAFGRLATMVLKLYEDKTKGTKIKRRSLVQMPGQAAIDVIWNGEDLRGQTTAYVPLEAILPRSRAAQMEMAKDLLAAQLITTLPEFLAVAELPGARDILSVTNPHIEQARRENSQFGLGRQSIPEEWHDHEAHIHEHNIFRTSVDYLMLSPEDKEMIEDHIKAHEVLASKEIGNARMRSNIDPALGMGPTAAEGPKLAPLDMMASGGGGGGSLPNGGAGLPAAAQDALAGPMGMPGPTPDEAASEIMALLSGQGGGI